MPGWTVDDLSLRQKVGQLFVVGFDGPDVPSQFESLLTDWGVGGVLYFARNLSTPSQTEALSASLQRLAANANLPPLLVAIDQEGGPVTRVSWGADPPSAMAVGATGREAVAAEVGAAIGEELRALVGDVSRRDVVQRFLETFDRLRSAPDKVLPAWRGASLTLGRRVRVTTDSGDVVGTAVDVEPPGHLVVETNEGSVRVHAGDCEHLRPA